MSDDRARRTARADFHRSVAYIQNVVEQWNATMPNGPEQPASIPLELLTDLAVLATLGPPLTKDERTYLDYDVVDEDEIEADPEMALTMLQHSRVMLLVSEIINTAATAAGHAEDDGFSKDREIRACQVAMNEAYREEVRNGPQAAVQEHWHIASAYLGNHEDGYWMLLGAEVDLEDDDES
jgi:hypothetical protein